MSRRRRAEPASGEGLGPPSLLQGEADDVLTAVAGDLDAAIEQPLGGRLLKNVGLGEGADNGLDRAGDGGG